MGVCTIGLKVWNKDVYGRREYVRRELCKLKKELCFSTILFVIIGRDKYISVLFFKCELGAVIKRGIDLVPDLRA